jgi:site-specific recombinase XerD
VAGDVGELEQAIALRDRAILELMYGSGLRVSEVASLTPDRVDIDRGRVLVFGKGSKEREVPMSDFARLALTEWIARGRSRMLPEDGSQALFLTASGPSHATSTFGRYGAHA